MSETAGGEAPLFTPLTAVLMALVGVFAFCALLVLFAYGSQLKSGDNGGGHALSRSAVGFAGLAEALRDAGAPVLISRHRLPDGRRAGLLIETPPPTARDDDVDNLNFDGRVLKVVPKWLAAPDKKHRGWVSAGVLADAHAFGKDSLIVRANPARRKGVTRPVLVGRGGPFARGQRFVLGPVDSLQTIDMEGWKAWAPVLVDERGGVVMAQSGNDFLLSDPDLLNNQALKDFSNFTAAVAIVETLRTAGGPVIFDVTLNGLGAERSALNLMFDPPFLAVTLCLATAAALAGFQAFFRFGPVRRDGRAVALGKQALADNTAALVRLAGRETAMGAPYADLTRDLAAKAVGAPRGLPPEALSAFLDRVGARRGLADTLGSLSLLARAAPDRARLIAVAARLHQWRTEITGEG
ncbi:MAG TPA: hypothetical protein VG166_15285 [Caulobacteraceae bacterium]|nr:hypothetical protein [Caulobacteraceae bacterium]